MPNLDSGPSNVHKLPISTLSPSSRESHKMEVGVYTWLLMVLLHTLHSYTLLNTNILVFYCTLKYMGEVMLIVFSLQAYGGLTRLLFDYIMFSVVVDFVS